MITSRIIIVILWQDKNLPHMLALMDDAECMKIICTRSNFSISYLFHIKTQSNLPLSLQLLQNTFLPKSIGIE